jgi:cysteine desulfurase
MEASHVLLAMGYSHEKAHGSLRFTLGKWTTEEHIDQVIDSLEGIVVKLRAISPLLKNK